MISVTLQLPSNYLTLDGFPHCISGQACPVTAYDKNGIRVLLHLAANSPAGRPDVLVMVASMLSTAPLLAKDIVLQAAVPKVKRQHAPNAFKLHVVSFRLNVYLLAAQPSKFKYAPGEMV